MPLVAGVRPHASGDAGDLADGLAHRTTDLAGLASRQAAGEDRAGVAARVELARREHLPVDFLPSQSLLNRALHRFLRHRSSQRSS
jgi:hypothetical protein